MPSFPTGLGYALGDDLLTSPFFDSTWTLYYVDSVNGSDVTGTGTRRNPYATFATAYTFAAGNDMFILADNHAETIVTTTINTRTAIVGAGKSQGYPTATFTAASGLIFSIQTDFFVVRNVKFIGTAGVI